MKGNLKFLLTVIAILLISTMMLTGCMYTIVTNKNDPKPYIVDTITDLVTDNLVINPDLDPENAPTSQSELQKKFEIYTSQIQSAPEMPPGIYASVAEECGIQFFSEEQAVEFKSRRDNGEMFTLSYEEILFIVNDSINQYFSYDYIILTNALEYGFTVSPNILPNSIGDYAIDCYHGDYTELLYRDDLWYASMMNQYERVLNDICDIIVYRLAMLDSTFVKTNIYVKDNVDIWMSVENTEPILICENRDNIYTNSYSSVYVWFKSMSYTEGMNKDEYLEHVRDEHAKFYVFQTSYSADMDPAYIYYSENSIFEIFNGKVSFWPSKELLKEHDYENLGIYDGSVFPTVELFELRPDKLDIMTKGATRAGFTTFTRKVYPEYNISIQTELLQLGSYRYTYNGKPVLKKGTSYKTLVDCLGIPYDSNFSEMSVTGYYITDKAIKISVTLEFDGDDYYITEVDGLLENSFTQKSVKAPFEDLSVDDLTTVSVTFSHVNKTIEIEEKNELVKLLNNVEFHVKNPIFYPTEQVTVFKLTEKDGSKIDIRIYGSHIAIGSTWYSCKDDSCCSALIEFANRYQ